MISTKRLEECKQIIENSQDLPNQAEIIKGCLISLIEESKEDDKIANQKMKDFYNKEKDMTFIEAIPALESGENVSRKAWANNDTKKTFICKANVQNFGEDEIDTICKVTTSPNNLFHNSVILDWHASYKDIIAADWYIIKEEQNMVSKEI